MATDSKTLQFYAQEACAYTSRNQQPSRKRLEAFLSMVSAGATILELGCGAGHDSEFMISKGFKVRPTDGTPEIAEAAERRLGIPVPVLLFGDLNEAATCDGIWANACLLHIPRDGLAGTIARIHTALKKGAPFYASFKAGDEGGRDQFGRYYNYPSKGWLQSLYACLSWKSVTIETGRGGGYDNQPTDWLYVMAIKA